MKQYPSLPLGTIYSEELHVFDKLDGSNIRTEWDKKKGWTLFGSRKKMVDEESSLKKAISIFKESFAEPLEKIFRDKKWENVVPFFEFWGPNSAFGQHEKTDEHTLSLIDVSVHRKGIVLPEEFLSLFGHLDHAKCLYRGLVDQAFVEQVESGALPGMTFEGVVCKGGYQTPGRPIMYKIKNKAWIEKLREYCAGNVELFRELL